MNKCCDSQSLTQNKADSDCCDNNSATQKTNCCDSKQASKASSCCESEVNAAQQNYVAQTVSQSCCAKPAASNQSAESGCCPPAKNKVDWLLWLGTGFVSLAYLGHVIYSPDISWLKTITATSFEMMNKMWLGIFLGMFAVGWLNRIPRDVIVATLGPGHSKRGVFRATLAGLLLDLCNHGILMVGMKLYERGASLGQVMAFIIASPWNSLTITIILISLIGIKWTLLIILGSLLVAWVSGYIFDQLEKNGHLPANPNLHTISDDFELKPAIFALLRNADYSPSAWFNLVVDGAQGSRMVIRWIMVGIVMVALVRAFVPADSFNQWFGATSAGLLLTLLAATIIEVCSEGSAPLAADLINRASAPGNSFTFLMAGAATDYTEIMVLHDTTRSWKIALFLPLITVPQILLIGWLMNLSS